MKRRYNMPCPDCGEAGTEIRRIDTLRSCPWSIIGHMECSLGHKWTTYLKDEARITPFDFEEDDEMRRTPPRRERKKKASM